MAQIACEEMGLGSTSICAALLHDVVEDTDYTVEDISNIFGAKVAQIVMDSQKSVVASLETRLLHRQKTSRSCCSP